MTAYTSGKTHRDPKPYMNYHGNRQAIATPPGGFCSECVTEYKPRISFDNHNPILVAFRKFNAADPALDTAEGWLWGIGNGYHDPASPEQIAHARRVLSKLAALTENGVTD